MKIVIKSTENKPSLEAMKILRQNTSFGMEEIRNRFANHEAIFEFDKYDENREILFEVIKSLKVAGTVLEFYEADDDFEELISEEMIRNLFESSDNYSDHD